MFQCRQINLMCPHCDHICDEKWHLYGHVISLHTLYLRFSCVIRDCYYTTELQVQLRNHVQHYHAPGRQFNLQRDYSTVKYVHFLNSFVPKVYDDNNVICKPFLCSLASILLHGVLQHLNSGI